MTHTPGPWDFRSILSDKLGRFAVICVNDTYCPGTAKQIVALDVRTKNDARLIAAAPDLLVSMAALLGCVNVRIDDRRTPIFDEARRVFVAAGGILPPYPGDPHA